MTAAIVTVAVAVVVAVVYIVLHQLLLLYESISTALKLSHGDSPTNTTAAVVVAATLVLSVIN